MAADVSSIYEKVLRDGYALNEGELDAGVFSCAAPLFAGHHLAGALGVVGPSERMLGAFTRQDYAVALIEHAQKIGALLGLHLFRSESSIP